MARCEICGEGTAAADGVPDLMCWDGRATERQIHQWMSRALQATYSCPERDLVAQVSDLRSVPALRSYLGIEGHPHLLSCVIRSLARCGDAGEEPRIRPFLDHPDAYVRTAARQAITEFDLPDAADLIAAGLDVAGLDDETMEPAELGVLLECLLWLEDSRALAPLRHRLERDGVTAELGARLPVATTLAEVGTADDHRRIAELGVADLERCAAPEDTRPDWARKKGWIRTKEALAVSAPLVLAEATGRLSDRARALAESDPRRADHDMQRLASSQPGPRTVARRSIIEYTDVRPDSSASPPAKFCGQPDWRDEPAWPVGSDGRLLMFYGQLPLVDGRTAYLFTAGPDEWEFVGGGSALIVQPGNVSHLPTRPVATGPQAYDWFIDRPRFLHRRRRLPAAEKFAVLADGHDPEVYDLQRRATDGDWEKIGGTPLWLQGDETPGEGWDFAFQFTAGLAAGERGDGAVFYGFVTDDGRGALGWQCH